MSRRRSSIDAGSGIADGFALLDLDDQRQLELELPDYDAVYNWAQRQVADG